jgi:hypothetical protein
MRLGDKMRKIEFTGELSGDWECFCWDVDLETYKRIKQSDPKKYDHSRFNEGMYRIYPTDIFGPDIGPVKVKIEWEEL